MSERTNKEPGNQGRTLVWLRVIIACLLSLPDLWVDSFTSNQSKSIPPCIYGDERKAGHHRVASTFRKHKSIIRPLNSGVRRMTQVFRKLNQLVPRPITAPVNYRTRDFQCGIDCHAGYNRQGRSSTLSGRISKNSNEVARTSQPTSRSSTGVVDHRSSSVLNDLWKRELNVDDYCCSGATS